MRNLDAFVAAVGNKADWDDEEGTAVSVDPTAVEVLGLRAEDTARTGRLEAEVAPAAAQHRVWPASSSGVSVRPEGVYLRVFRRVRGCR